MAEEEKTGGGPEDLDYDRSEEEEKRDEGGPDASGPLEANLDGTITLMHKLLQSKLSEIDAGTASLTPETLTLIDKLYGAIDRKHAAMDARSKAKSRSGGPLGEGRSGGATSRTSGGDGGGGGSGRGGGGSSRSSRRSSRPFCTYPHCGQPVGHYFERCFQRRRDAEVQAKKDGKATAERTGTGGAKRAKKTDGNDE